ncbi:hypothetical protein CGJ69_23935 [Vibrio parahaemolyticus]|nr:hypothetical protein CGJ69_23935 [Vibrio parahaemolyticus]
MFDLPTGDSIMKHVITSIIVKEVFPFYLLIFKFNFYQSFKFFSITTFLYQTTNTSNSCG